GNWFSRYFKTIGMVMIHPSRAINRVHVQKPLFDAWKFLLTTLIIMVFVGTIPMALLAFGIMGRVGSQPNYADLLFMLGGQVLLYFAVYIIFAVVWGLTAHVLLQLTGGSTFTLRRTMQAILYSSGSIIIGIVPCCGGLASFVWWIVSATNMVKKGQRVHGGRASLAVVMPPLVAVICVCGFYIYIMNSFVGNARSAAATAATNAASRQSTTINPENIPEDELLMEPRSE
ncbi:MAG: YIP1 family protein, partial [Phycisphaerae bacterium]|nr:YIP1 family protein [Phycisphaerae bacterium]